MTEMLTIILPFYNEQGWIGKTVSSLCAQTDQRFKLLLIDNGSTDDGAVEALTAGQMLGERLEISHCAIAGKTNALSHGLDLVDTPLVASCDADTIYCDTYVSNIISLFDQHPNAAAVMAIDLYGDDADQMQDRKDFVIRKSIRFADKCHAGGCAQAFRTEILKAAGGFCTTIWPYVLEDHEIIHRVHQHGYSVYHPDHVCYPSERRILRTSVSWNKLERLMYRYMPKAGMDWYFYSFLGPRLAARNSLCVALREEREWERPLDLAA